MINIQPPPTPASELENRLLTKKLLQVDNLKVPRINNCK
jgi:hypothetical protein